MLKKIILALAAFIASMSFAFAQVEANKADQAALDGVKGIGPKLSKTIIEERKKGGDFKDWADFEKRVKGVGEKSAVKLSQSGLTINGQAKANAAPASASAKAAASKPAASAPAAADNGAKNAASKPASASAASAK